MLPICIPRSFSPSLLLWPHLLPLLDIILRPRPVEPVPASEVLTFDVLFFFFLPEANPDFSCLLSFLKLRRVPLWSIARQLLFRKCLALGAFETPPD